MALLICTSDGQPFVLELVATRFILPDLNPVSWALVTDQPPSSWLRGQASLRNRGNADDMGRQVCDFQLANATGPQGDITGFRYPVNEGSTFQFTLTGQTQGCTVIKSLPTNIDFIQPRQAGIVVGTQVPGTPSSQANQDGPRFSKTPPTDVPFRRPGCQQVFYQTDPPFPSDLYFWMERIESQEAGWMMSSRSNYASGTATLAVGIWTLKQGENIHGTIRVPEFKIGAECQFTLVPPGSVDRSKAIATSKFKVISIGIYSPGQGPAFRATPQA
ncbi:MAG: hypothetical protein ABSF22_07565 [Bryobacteraceae bacterium]